MIGRLQNKIILLVAIQGVSWEEVELPLKIISPLWLFLFLFYISFSYLAVLNVVTGVFCQSASWLASAVAVA